MKTALKYPDLVRRLIVVDIAPTAGPETISSEAEHLIGYIKGMKAVDLKAIRSREEAETVLEAYLSVILSCSTKKDLIASFEQDPVERVFLLTNLVPEADLGNGRHSYKWRIPLDILEKTLHNIRNFDMSKEIESGMTYTKPTLFIGGGNSNYISKKNIPVIEKLFPNASVKVIPGAGHWVQAEKPNEFIEVVKQFMLTADKNK